MEPKTILYYFALGILLLMIHWAIHLVLDSCTDTFTNYTVAVQSADKLCTVHKGVIYIKLIGDDDNVGKEVELLARFLPEKFKRGYQHVFKIQQEKIKNIRGLHVRGGKSVGEPGWNIDRFIVTDETTSKRTIIPVFITIRSDRHYKFIVHDDALPQSAPNSQKGDRDRDLQEMRTLYELTEERLPGCPPLAKQVPPEEMFSCNYIFRIGSKAVPLRVESTFETLFSHEFRTIEDIQKVFHRASMFPEPSNLNRWRDDVLFGMQRLICVNPNVIRLCTTIPDKLAVNNQMLKPFLENLTLKQALLEKRIFIIDYEILDNIHPKEGYVLTAPIALFYQRYDGYLVPVAIQLFQKPGAENPVFLPSDRVNTWILAKMWFNVADANYHESVTHLGFTHLKMEGIVVCTHRQIHRSHPLFKLLMPHFYYLLAVNHVGIQELMDRHGFVDQVLTVGSDGVKELIRRKNKIWRMDIDGDLFSDLKTRGVYDPDNPNLLPHYYYRDDALKLYKCIYSYVTKYLNLYYKSDSDILEDYELQNWRKELVTPVEEQGLGILGVYGEDGKFTKKEQVTRTLTSIIFTCSVQHAAVNDRQYEEYAFPPNYPASLRGRPPYTKDHVDENQLLKSLPSKEMMYTTMVIMNILSTEASHQFGDFEVEYITDEEALKVVAEFRSELETISETIKNANKNWRHQQYSCLDPKVVPNSIKI